MATAIKLDLKNLWEIKAADEPEFDNLVAVLKPHFTIPYSDRCTLTFPISAADLKTVSETLGNGNPGIELTQIKDSPYKNFTAYIFRGRNK